MNILYQILTLNFSKTVRVICYGHVLSSSQLFRRSTSRQVKLKHGIPALYLGGCSHRPVMWTHSTRSGHCPRKVHTPLQATRKGKPPPTQGGHTAPAQQLPRHTVSAKVASKRSSHHPLRSGHTTPVQREEVQPPPMLGGNTDPV